MKIGLDARCLMDQKYSGVAWYAFNLFQELLANDQINDYLLFYNSSRLVKMPDFVGSNHQYRDFHYPNKLFNLSLNWLARPYLDQLLGGCDWFFSPNLHFSSVSKKCRSAVAVHDLSFLVYPDFFNYRQKLWHYLILRQGILKRADLIFADSYATKSDLLDLLNVPEEKIQVVGLGVGENYFVDLSADQLEAVSKKYSLPKKFVLFLGTIEPRKNLSGVIDSMAYWPEDCDLVVAGNWGWKYQEIKNKLKNNQRIKVLGYLDEVDKPAVYRLAQALAYPSFYEGFGLPILEAMASGCPVVAGDNSGQIEVLASTGLLVNPFDVSAIGRAIKVLLEDSTLKNSLVAEAKIRAREFSWQKTAQQVKHFLETK